MSWKTSPEFGQTKSIFIMEQSITDLTKKIHGLEAQVAAIVQKIIDKIKALPDNPDIERLPCQANCFIMLRSNLLKTTNLKPETYDFKLQYAAVAKLLEKQPNQVGIDKVNEAIRVGAIRIHEGIFTYNYTLHPQVIENIKSIL
jgi:hypothetical protein